MVQFERKIGVRRYNVINKELQESIFLELLKAYNGSRHFDTTIETATLKDMSKYLTHNYESKQYHTVESNNSIEAKFHLLFKEDKRQIEENVLFDVLRRFYFADWTRACDYEKMTPEEVMKAAMSVCKEIEKDYNYNIDDDLCCDCMTWTLDWEGDYID